MLEELPGVGAPSLSHTVRRLTPQWHRPRRIAKKDLARVPLSSGTSFAQAVRDAAPVTFAFAGGAGGQTK